MDREERAFRRMTTEAVLSGPNRLTRAEIHSALGVGKNMVAAARKLIAEKASEVESEEASRPNGRWIKSRRVTSALERMRKTTKFSSNHSLIKRFFIEKSTNTSRQRDLFKEKLEVSRHTYNSI